MLQNLTKGKMVEWVVLLVALVALGLSIAAVAKPCKSDFGDTCNPCSCPTYGEDECPTGTKCDCSKICIRRGYGSCMADSESSSGSGNIGGGGSTYNPDGSGNGSTPSPPSSPSPPSLKPDFPKFVFMGNKCVQKPKVWAGTTFPSKLACEKAMGLIIGPGGQDSHPEPDNKPNLPLILGLSGGGLVLVLVITFLLM